MDFPVKRLPNESAKAFEAFCCYCELGVDRTIDKVFRIITKQESSTKLASGLFNKWSKEYHWVDRAREYDNFRFLQDQEMKAEARKKAMILIVDRLEKNLIQDLDLSEALTERLKKFVDSEKFSPLILRNICAASKDIIKSKASIFDSYFRLIGGEAIAEEISRKLRESS